jgi:hypothetical protein
MGVNFMKLRLRLAALVSFGFCTLAFATPSFSGTCVGSCGTLGADGDVAAPPVGTTYNWVSNYGGDSSIGFPQYPPSNGSYQTTPVFSALAGDQIKVYLNFVSTDEFFQVGSIGAGDYAWAFLMSDINTISAVLFTAQVASQDFPIGPTAPASGLAGPVDATLDPATSMMIDGAPNWSPLGPDSGSCAGPGCGYTGWIGSTYDVASSGNYFLMFGVANFSDFQYSSGLAFTAPTLNGAPIEITSVPEPLTLAVFGAGFAGAAILRRRKGNKA